ncbi:hypothetical protein GQ43DRAFT_442522 [Delitschia confertaspora ATCC 74209]|uniref:Uncharacterized protein n=1 Tax=Delitschia confertaspora ATCC 74209 TaxID=1513339 RepID=A0A9P4JMV2_9PLEO|nr:hypothetical protein GQ43DRAFT_442522 [Delitschia confertaspora ATCC 74209]
MREERKKTLNLLFSGSVISCDDAIRETVTRGSTQLINTCANANNNENNFFEKGKLFPNTNLVCADTPLSISSQLQ